MMWADNASYHPLGGPLHSEGPESTPPGLGPFSMTYSMSKRTTFIAETQTVAEAGSSTAS